MRILLVRTDRLGEVILTLPAVSALRAASHDAWVTLMVQPELQELLQGAPAINAFIAYRDEPARPWWRKAAALARLLRGQRFDLAVIANAKKEFHAAAFLAGIPIRVGYDRKWGRLLTHRVTDAKALGDRHEVEYNLDLVRVLGLPTSTPQWQWPSFAREQDEIAHLLERLGLERSEPFMAIHPWASNPIKQWPVGCAAAFIHAVSRRMPVVLVGGPQERARLPEELTAARPGVADLVGRTSLRQLAALLARARLLVSSDSGPAHLAAALGTPTVTLFGAAQPATGPGRWGPWGAGHAVICKPSMEAIAVEDVLTAVDRFLLQPRDPV